MQYLTVTLARCRSLAYCFIYQVIQITSHGNAVQENEERESKNKKNLEENSLSVPTESAADGLGSGKSWVRSYILQDLCSLSSSVVHLIPIDTVIVRYLLNQTSIVDVICNCSWKKGCLMNGKSFNSPFIEKRTQPELHLEY